MLSFDINKILIENEETFNGFIKNTVERYGLSLLPNNRSVVLLNDKCMSCKQNHNTGNIIVSNGFIKYKCEYRDYEFDLFKITIDPNVHKSIFSQKIVNAVYNGQRGIVELLLTEFISLIKCCDNKTILLYNGMTRLWQSLSIPGAAFVLGYWVGQSLENHISSMIKYRENIDISSNDYKTWTEIIYTTNKLLEQTLSLSYMKNVISSLIDHIYDSNNSSCLAGDSDYFPILDRKVINLTNGQISERDSTHNFTYECNVNYLGNDYDCVNAKKFMKDLFKDNESVEYMQKMMGYFLTGKTLDKSLYIFCGGGRNGKSSLISILERIMSKGNYINKLSNSLFIDNGKNDLLSELTGIIGSRLCIISDDNQRKNLNVNRIKQLLKDDTISYRKKYNNKVITFRHSSKFLLITDDPPYFDVDQITIRDSIKYIPLNTKFVKKDSNEEGIVEDQNFINELKTEKLNEIFTYFVQGAIKYNQNNNMEIPSTHKIAYDEYIESLDDLSMFIKTECETEPDNEVRTSEFLNKYNEWARKTNAKILTSKTLKFKMERRNYKYGKSRGDRCYKGIKLKHNYVI